MALAAFFDTETTGLSFEKGHRMIEIAIILYDLDSKAKKLEFVRRMNPGRTIDPKAQLVHHIRQSDLTGAKTFAMLEPSITKILNHVDVAIAHNISFDIDFLFGEYSLLKKRIPDVQGFCTMSNGRWATSFGKNPNLKELCFACDVDYDPDLAHSALYDTERLAECFFYANKNGEYNIEALLKK